MSELDQPTYAPPASSVQRIAISATGAVTALGAGLTGTGWIRVLADGADVDVLFGPSTLSAPTFQATGTGATVGYTVKNGTYHDFYNTGVNTHVGWDASGAGFLTLAWSGRRRTGTT